MKNQRHSSPVPTHVSLLSDCVGVYFVAKRCVVHVAIILSCYLLVGVFSVFSYEDATEENVNFVLKKYSCMEIQFHSYYDINCLLIFVL